MLRSLTRLPLAGARMACTNAPARAFTTSFAVRKDAQDIIDETLEKITPREAIERQRKEMEAKYAEKLKQKVEAEGMANLDALKEKVVAPSILAKRKAKQYRAEEAAKAEAARKAEEENRASAAKDRTSAVEQQKEAARATQAAGDRSGVKPLASIINLPLILMTPHDAQAIGDIWNTYHATHPTLSPSYLSASLPAATYDSMMSLAKVNPFFVLPLPRETEGEQGAFEMFYLQWIFHGAPTAPPLPPAADGTPHPAAGKDLPPVSSVIFTPLEEFKQAGEWAQPYLTLTFYPDLSASHGTVLMRGEIAPASAANGPAGSIQNPGYLLAQEQAQLLALGLQRFYCANIAPPAEDAKAGAERAERARALVDFREKPQEWDWHKLVGMAYAGIA